MKSANSAFKFSAVTRENFTTGTAMFTLQNMGALARKLKHGEQDVVLKFIEETAAAYLMKAGVVPPPADYTPPVEQEST